MLPDKTPSLRSSFELLGYAFFVYGIVDRETVWIRLAMRPAKHGITGDRHCPA